MSDAHDASDVIAGAGIGWFYGYLMPKLLHYRSASPVFAWAPSFAPTIGGGFVTVGRAF